VQRSEIFLNAIKLPADLIAAIAAFFVAKIIRLHPTFLSQFQTPADTSLISTEFIKFAIIASLGLVLIFAWNGLYRMRGNSMNQNFRKIIFLVGTWLLLITAYFFFRREFFFSRLVIVYTGILTILFVFGGRLLIQLIKKIFWKFGIGTANILIIGSNPNSLLLSKYLENNSRYRFLGFIEVDKLSHKFSKKPIGKLNDLSAIVQSKKIKEIILASRKLSHQQMRELLSFARINHLEFSFIPDLLEVAQKNVEIEEIYGIPLISLRPTPLTGWRRIWKRIFDLCISVLTLLLTMPFWLIAAIFIKLDSTGPIFFAHKDDGKKVLRIGKHGKPFWFIKFRTMRAKSDSLRYSLELQKQNIRSGTPLVKIVNDPRITKIGRFMRRYSIDELPQLLNVLTGKMSLVGPRPHLPEEVAKYKPHHQRVLEIKPGITGLAQISGRSDLHFDEEVELDAWYIENWSLWLDLKILCKTVGVVLFPSHKE
jgi:exopolysaccharide biosynthesis polyprenyl glycosylphosphotransferase